MLKNLNSRGGCDFIIFALAGLFMALIPSAYANNSTAVGYWQTIDPDTHQLASIIQIAKNPKNGRYYGKIFKIFSEGTHHSSDRCTHCPGDQYNHPMLGLTIIRDMRFNGRRYVGGMILDPRNGKEYHATLTVIDQGQALKLRGYIGLPIFGETRVWQRATKSQV